MLSIIPVLPWFQGSCRREWLKTKDNRHKRDTEVQSIPCSGGRKMARERGNVRSFHGECWKTSKGQALDSAHQMGWHVGLITTKSQWTLWSTVDPHSQVKDLQILLLKFMGSPKSILAMLWELFTYTQNREKHLWPCLAEVEHGGGALPFCFISMPYMRLKSV
jgi:hypothetical protein